VRWDRIAAAVQVPILRTEDNVNRSILAATSLAVAAAAGTRKSERPKGYPAPIVDHSAQRAEALRRYQSIG